MSHKNGDDAYDDERLIRYLVGSLDDQTTERFDELSIADDAFATRLRAAEDDLVDAYVRGDLSADVRDSFESRYLSAPAGRDKVRFAEALLAHQIQAAAVDARAPNAGLRSDRGPWVPPWAMAAAAMLVLAVGGYWLVEVSPVQAPTQPAQLPRAEAATQPAAPGVPSPQGSEPLPRSARVLSFVLLPPTRGVSEPPTLAVPSDATKVEVRVVLESDDFPRYQVALKDPGTDLILWRSARIKPSSLRGDRILPVTLDATLLKPRRYALELTGYRAAGEAELVSSYPFRVVVQ